MSQRKTSGCYKGGFLLLVVGGEGSKGMQIQEVER